MRRHAPRYPQSSRGQAPAASAPPGRADRARAAAYSHLADIAARLPDLDPRPLPDRGLSERDAAFAHAIVHAGLQRWLTLAHLLSSFLNRPFPDLEPDLRGALIGGSAQILILDKVPVHAAINETVEWAKTTIRPGAGAMVNAVLRKVAGLLGPEGAGRQAWTDRRDQLLLADGSARALSGDALPESEAERLAVVTSHPLPMVRAWLTRMGAESGRRLLQHSLMNPPTVLYTGAARGELPGSLAPHDSPRHRVFAGPHSELQRLLAARDDLWVQDAASSAAVLAAADLRPRLVLDLCAGQGTKTRQLTHVFGNSRIVATDTDEARLDTLRKVFAGSAQVEAVDPAEVERACSARADLVLLDVPCSNTGVLARRIEAKYRWSERMLERMARLQRSILERARPLLAPGGRILYSTCSVEETENQRQAEWAASTLGLRLETARLMLPEGVPGDPASRFRDGSFHAILAADG